MNKTISLVILSLMVISMLGAVSATPVSSTTTVIAGRIYYNPDLSTKVYNTAYSTLVPGATVTVTCGNQVDTPLTSDANGMYIADFTDCGIGDKVTIEATGNTPKGKLQGKNFAKVTGDNLGVDLSLGYNLENSDVPLVPEFGLLAGTLTVLGSVGMFFVVRRK